MKSPQVGFEYLHEEYATRTRSSLPYSDAAGTLWWQWLAWRAHQPFNARDLRLVIAWLRREIRAGRRHPASLEFARLIGQPEVFAQYLGLAGRWVHQRKTKAAKPLPPWT